MEKEILDLAKRLDHSQVSHLDIINWAAPVTSFGNPQTAKIATLGLNPSDREFTDSNGKELIGTKRRFHTLNSLGLEKWGDLSVDQAKLIAGQCRNYFSGNPYDGWFKKLDFLISGTSLSYYFPSQEACHLDLVPFATSTKWAKLSREQRKELLSEHGDILAKLINSSVIKIIILNGTTVINNFKLISDADYTVTSQPTWNLSRADGKDISGFSYECFITRIGDMQLKEKIAILGFNHNIQSSFGITSYVQSQIRVWIANQSNQLL